MNASFIQSGWGKRLAKQTFKGRQKFKPTIDTNRWNIVTGDKVQVIQGPQTGQEGKVLAVLRKKYRVIIEGVNMRRRTISPGLDGSPGKIVSLPCSVHYSNVMLLDPSTGMPTKVSRKYLEDGTKVRVSKKSGEIINKPDPLANRKPRSMVTGPKDTLKDEVFEVTFTDYEKYLPYIYASKKKPTTNTATSANDTTTIVV